MKLLPGIDFSNLDYQLTPSEGIIIVSIAYFSITVYTIMLILECHNVYYYLIKQHKYRVIPMTLFYLFAIPCCMVRIWMNIYIVPGDALFNPFFAFCPACLKICIGMAQILVMIELHMRVKQTIELLKYSE